MRLLMPIGVLLILIGTGGSVAACFGNSVFGGPETKTATQLQNQNQLDALDTNQFTQRLVQFAQVEQQINMNQSLSSLIALQSATQASAALGFLG